MVLLEVHLFLLSVFSIHLNINNCNSGQSSKVIQSVSIKKHLLLFFPYIYEENDQICIEISVNVAELIQILAV